MAALPRPRKYLDVLHDAGIETGTARRFWGGVTSTGRIVVTTWMDGGDGPDRFWIWKPETNHGGLRDEWDVGNIREGTEVSLILLHQRGNVPLNDRASLGPDRRPARRQVAGARLMPGQWRVVKTENDPNGWPGAIVELVNSGAARTLKDTGTECKEVYGGDRLIARIVPHDTGFGWKGVDLTGKALTKQPYATPELVLQYLPADL